MRDCPDPGRNWRLGCCLTNGKRRGRSGTQGPCFLPDRQRPEQERENARPHWRPFRKPWTPTASHNRIEDYSIAIGLARAGDIKAALAIVDAMAARDQSPNPILLADLAAIEAQAGDFPAARAIAGMIADPGAAGIAWEKIARAQAEAGHEAEALQWAEALKDPLHRSRALLGVAEGLAARRKRETQQKP